MGIGNPAADRSVKQYLANVREEQLKARVVQRQAEPFLVGDLVTISEFIHARIQECANSHRQPKLCGSSLDFEFIRECMKIDTIRPKFRFWTKIEIKITYLVCVLLFTVSSPLEPFGSRFIDRFKI